MGLYHPMLDLNVSAYRFGFNNMEKDNEAKGIGNSYDFGARIYDSRLGRFLSLDPLMSKQAFVSPYSFAWNQPIWAIDANGEIIVIVITHETDENGNSQVYQTELDITTGEDVRGIERSAVTVHRYVKVEQVPNPELPNYYMPKYTITKIEVAENTGETYGETWKRTHPLSYYLSKAMINVPVTGSLANATTDRDMYTKEYRTSIDKYSDVVAGVLDAITLGRGAVKGELVKKIVDKIKDKTAEVVLTKLLEQVGIKDQNKKAIFGYHLLKLAYQGKTGQIKSLTEYLLKAASVTNKASKAVEEELKNQHGIDLNIPLDKDSAIEKAITNDGATKQN